MKKLLFAIAILFAVNCQAQDTTYVLKRAKLYQVTRVEVTDASAKQKYIEHRLKQNRKYRRINRIAFGVFATVILLVWKP
jgi:hypothetical protein